MVSFVQVEHRLKKAFEHVGEARRLLMVLRLKSGTEVALAGRWWAGSKDVALLKGDPRLRDRQVVAEFRSLTGFTEDEITLLYTPRHGRTLLRLSRPPHGTTFRRTARTWVPGETGRAQGMLAVPER